MNVTNEFIAHLAYVSHFCEPKHEKPFCAGVLVQGTGDKVVMVATNGYTMSAAIFDCESPHFEAILPFDGIKTMLGMVKKDLSETVCGKLKIEGLNVTFTTNQSTTSFQKIDVKYVEWQKYIPHDRHCQIKDAIGVDLTLLGLVEKGFKGFAKYMKDFKRPPHISMKFGTERDAILIKFGNPQMLGIQTVIMPCRI